MFQINKKIDYGLQLMVYLAQNYSQKDVSLKQLAKEKKLPYRFLGQIVIPLKKEKLIDAKEGVNGGYHLTKAPEKTSLKEIISAIEGKISVNDCAICGKRGGCGAGKFWYEVENKILTELQNKKLSEII